MKAHLKKLLENENFLNFLDSNIEITNPMKSSEIISLFELRALNALEQAKDDKAKKLKRLSKNIKTMTKPTDMIVGVAVSTKTPYVFYFDEEFKQLLGSI